MPLPNSGVMSLGMIRGEFGQSGNVALSRYYRGGGLVPNSPKNYNISTGGRISHSMFFGASKEMTPEEAGQLAADGRYVFSKENSNWIGPNFQLYQDKNYQNGMYNNAVFPNHKGGLGNWNFQWYFNNMGFGATEDKCTVVLSSGGRGPGAPGLNYVRRSNGTNVGFRTIYASSWDDNYATGEAISIFEVDCDRREVIEINSYHSTWWTGRAHVSGCYILPGGNYGVLSVASYPNTNAATILPGEMVAIAMGGMGGGWDVGVSGDTVLQCSAEWYNFCISAMVYGDTNRAWSMHGTGMLGQNRDVRFVTLRKLRAGESPSNRFIHNTWLSTRVGDRRYDYFWRPGSSWYMYAGHVIWLDQGRGNSGVEQTTIVSWSCDNPNVVPVMVRGRIWVGVRDYYNTPTDGEAYSNFSITLRSVVSGQQYSVSTGAGNVFAYTQSNGD